MRSIGTLFFLTIISISVSGQSWNKVDLKSVRQLGERNINPDNFIIANVDDAEIKNILWNAPQELNFNPNRDQHTLLEVMMADGNMETFSIVQYQMMEPGLAKRYSHIRTFHGLSTKDPARRIRINYTVHGLRATITDQNGQTYIDHFQRNDKAHKIIYKRNNFSAHEDWACEFKAEEHSDKNQNKSTGSKSGDCLFRSYRFSMTATGEYSNYHGATSEADSSLVMSAIVTTVDRVNDVLEQDITVRLVLIDNVDDVFYYDSSTDPFSGTSSGSMISQNQTNTDAVIGSANYDLGHIVSTGGSGLASLGVVCFNGLKARGVTGISIPEGDPFDIDYVAHEIGHQLGANHTQNNDNCNRNNETAMEPGSASTIMGYAGICSPNIQSNSDAYFHAISVEEMNDVITGNSCHGTISLSNSAPVANPLTNKAIPHSTPFVLDVVATDPDGDVLTYNWEQMDNEVGAMPPSGTNSQGPMFRSNFALNDSKRYFPNLDTLTANATDQWEVLPTVDRNMKFRVTVRDNTFAPGCTDEQDITLDVEGSAGPFLVTSQNTATVWKEIEDVTITWDVANTDLSPVNCSHVDILISYDSGLTYPTTILSNTINDGSAVASVPVGISTTARIMVKCSDNVFFDINDTDIVINQGDPSFTINANPQSDSVCDDMPAVFTLESDSLLGFTDPITLSVSGLPPGATSNIATNPILPNNSTTITIDDFDGESGLYSILITGVSGAITKETTYDLTIENAAITPVLSVPANGSLGILENPTLRWVNTPGASNYEYQVSSLPNGGNVINSGLTTLDSVIITPGLSLSTTYYWRVRSITSCGTTPWSQEWTFETKTCVIKYAEDLPIPISSNGTPTITSNMSFIDKGLVTDLNIIDLEGTHSYVSDLNFTLFSPDGTNQQFWDDPCNQQNDFDINFDDEATTGNHPCPPTDGMTYIPEQPLTVFDTKQLSGEWTMSVFDDFDADGGSFNSWGLEICLEDYCDLTVDKDIYINTHGTLKRALECAVDGDTIYLETSIAGSTIDMGTESIIIDQNIVIIAAAPDNIKFLSASLLPTITINAGKTVSLLGFDIENVTSTTGVILNNGTLTIVDMDVTSGIGLHSIVNSPGSDLKVEGDCRVFEN